MNTITEEVKTTPIIAEVDVCVVGGGSAGIAAALAAARRGARTCLIETQPFCGGVATAAQVCVWHPLTDIDGKRTIIAGITAELVDRLEHRGAIRRGPPGNVHNGFTFNPHELILLLDEMLLAAGVKLYFCTRAVAVAMQSDRIDAVIIEDASGRRAIRARQCIDASGDGVLARLAGAAIDRPGQLQPPTQVLTVAGLDRLRETPGFRVDKALFDPSIPGALPKGFAWEAAHLGDARLEQVYATRVHGADCGTGEGLTAALLEGRRQAGQILKLFRYAAKDDEALRQSIGLVGLAPMIGIRETRHVRCKLRMDGNSLLMGQKFPDTIAHGTYPVDIHHADRGGVTLRYLDGTERIYDGLSTRVGRWRPEGERTLFYNIPFRCLIPSQGAKNLVVAGRCVDADESAFGAIRVMVTCLQMGEAAGAAAALSGDSIVGDIDPQRLRADLKSRGAALMEG